MSIQSTFEVFQYTNVSNDFANQYTIDLYNINEIDFEKFFECIKTCNNIKKCISFVRFLNSNGSFECLFFNYNPSVGSRINHTLNSNLYIKKGIIPIQSSRNYLKYIESDFITYWGVWNEITFCPGNSFAFGLQVQIDFVNDTGLNQIRLICNDASNTSIESGRGVWGNWSEIEFCSLGKKLVGFTLKVEGYQPYSDDSAANGINMICEDGQVLKPSLEGNEGKWGRNKKCTNNLFICGIETQIEPELSNFEEDNTALNNVAFYCCPP